MNNRVIPSVYAALQFQQQQQGVVMGKEQFRLFKQDITRAAYMLGRNFQFEKQALEDKANENLKNLASKSENLLLGKKYKDILRQKYRATLYNTAGFPIIISGSNWTDIKNKIAESAGIPAVMIGTAPVAYDDVIERTYNKGGLIYKYYIFVAN